MARGNGGHPLKDQIPTPRPPRRLKGKNRKRAREAEKATDETIAATRYVLPTSQFIDLADWIANLKPSLPVPGFVLSCTRSAVQLRKCCAEWFQKSNAEELEPDNSGHSHFIGVLERVLQILEPNSATESIASGQESKHGHKIDAGAKSRAEIEELINFYDVLSVDEDAFDHSAATRTDAPPAQNIGSYQATPSPPRTNIYEIERPAEEFIFALFCFFNDLNELRKFLLSLWLRYKDGSLDLMTASVTTNTAINLVSRIEEDLLATFPTSHSAPDIFQKFFDGMGEKRSRTSESVDTTIHAISNPEDWSFLSTQAMLIAFCATIHIGNVGIIIESSVSEGIQADQNALLEILTELFFLTRIDDAHVTDELTNGLDSIISAGTFPLWMSFAAQISIDIHNALGECVERGFSELQAFGTHITSVLKGYYDSGTAGIIQELSDFKSLSKIIDLWIPGDALDRFKGKFRNPPVPVIRKPFSLFRRHPLFCGLLQFQL